MRIANIDTDRRVLIVAEIGNNHEGRMDVARDLVTRAGEAGADAVKFQTFRTELLVGSEDAARVARLKSFQLSLAQFSELADLARAHGLLFLSTPLDLPSAAGLEPLVDAFKIASGDVTFLPLLEQVARTGKPVVISSGAADIEEVRRAVRIVAAGGGCVGVLHCVSSYPVPEEQANLGAIRTLAETLGVTVGYSDHVAGIEAAVASVAAGARIVEKHFTLDHALSDFRDHQLSATPEELRAMVDRIRRVDAMLGSGVKVVQPCESALRTAIRRSAVLARDLGPGEPLTAADVVWLRPAGGIEPGSERTLFGRRTRRALEAGAQIDPADFE